MTTHRHDDVNPVLRIGVGGSLGALIGAVVGGLLALLGMRLAVPIALVSVGAIAGAAIASFTQKKLHPRQTVKSNGDERRVHQGGLRKKPDESKGSQRVATQSRG